MKKLLFLLSLFILSLLALILFNKWCNSRTVISENTIAGLQEELKEKELACRDIAKVLFKGYKEKEINGTLNKALIKRINELGAEILIIENDEVVYWTGNKAPIDEYSEQYINQLDNRLKKLENGYYYVIVENFDSVKLCALINVKSDYHYQNQFLKNEFHPSFNLDNNVEIIFDESINPVYNVKGDYIFSLQEGESKTKDVGLCTNLLFLLYFLTFMFLCIILLHLYRHFLPRVRYPILFLLAFVADILILRGLFYYFDYPYLLKSSVLFQSSLFSHSIIFPNLADSLLNIFCIAFLFFALSYFQVNRIKQLKLSILLRILWQIGTAIMAFILLAWGSEEILNITYNNSMNIDLNNLFDIRFNEFLFVIFVISLYTILFALIYAIIKLYYRLIVLKYQHLISAVLFLLAFPVFHFLALENMSYVLFAALMALVLFTYLHISIRKQKLSLGNVSIFILILSSVTTYTFYLCDEKKEIDSQQLFIEHITRNSEPLTEFKYCDIAEEIKKDTFLLSMLENADTSDPDRLIAVSYLENMFNDKYWDNYEILITVCNEDKVLNVLPDNFLINCNDYFTGLIQDLGMQSSCEDLFYMLNESLDKNFIGDIGIKTKLNNYHIYIELYSKFVPDGLGYPELLIGNESDISSYLKKYSFARYINNELVYKFGNYMYSYNLDNYILNDTSTHKFKRSEYTHYMYQTDDNSSILLSVPTSGFFDFVSPFAYILLFYSLFAAIYVLFYKRKYRKYSELNLRNRLQYSIIGILILSFIVIGILSVTYIIGLNNDKIETALKEKSHSVLIEMEHKLSDYENITPEMQAYVFEILNKFSQVFFSDINVYSLKGELIASSRPKLFEEGLISTRMNKSAYDVLRNEKKILFIQKERIGDYEYMSAYLPLKNFENKTMAYVNLPYFAKQDELQDEISTFITAFVNVFVIIFLLAFLLTVLVSRYITLPLALIREKISSLKLDNTDDKITWIREDEIGSLVKEYNRMLDELAKSAELLARTERESAWREMARQVAHEIKNPLTPMKLSVQHLMRTRTKQSDSENWDQQFEKVTKMLIEQIDTLSSIASDFSNFAKMPVSNDEIFNLAEVIKSAVQLYQNMSNVRFIFDFDVEGNYPVYADKKLIIRVFNNLFENAIHASEDTSEPQINIDVEINDKHYLVSVKDKGSGIPDDIAAHIFSPSFTTKTSGMGLGLAIVESIINNAKGKIYFESQPGAGTTFFIELPLPDQTNQ